MSKLVLRAVSFRVKVSLSIPNVSIFICHISNMILNKIKKYYLFFDLQENKAQLPQVLKVIEKCMGIKLP